MIEKLINCIGEHFPLKEKNAGEFARLKVRGMNFSVRCYCAEGLGHVSVMRSSGFFGLMKMDTLMIIPAEKDMPLLSYDRVQAMGNDTLIFELYDTLLGEASLIATEKAKAEGKKLPDHDVGTHWYDAIKLPISLAKKGKKTATLGFDKLAENYVMGFLSDSRCAASCDAKPKLEKVSVYVEGLLTHGGPSTDVFKKTIGEEKTAELFRKVLFGTEG